MGPSARDRWHGHSNRAEDKGEEALEKVKDVLT